MMDSQFDPFDYIRQLLSSCNHTELYQLCRRKGVQVEPSYSHSQLVEAYLSDQDTGPTDNVFDSWRRGLTGFVFDHWQVLAPQLTCPIKSHDPESCWSCLDAQVITCVESNKKYEDLVQLHRKAKK